MVLFSGASRADSLIGPDKALHASLSGALALGAYPAVSCVAHSRLVRTVGAFGIALFFGLGKEVADARGLGSPSWADMAWNAGGALVGALLALALDSLLIAPTRSERVSKRERKRSLYLPDSTVESLCTSWVDVGYPR
jgi:uncharacterized protein YfiM (DUF2279 family)